MSAVLEQSDRLDAFVTPPYPVRRFTVGEYHTMVASGALVEDDRVELLEGWIVPKVTHIPPHDWTVTRIAALLGKVLPDTWLLRVQCAVTTSDSEPDHAIVRTPDDCYLQRHPQGKDIGLIIEVAETSVARDRHKAAIYAADGIAVYWIINLKERQIEVHAAPVVKERRFAERRVLLPGETLDLELDGQIIDTLAVADLLPPATT